EEIGHLSVCGGQLARAEQRVDQADVHAPGVGQMIRIDVEGLINDLGVDLEEAAQEKLEDPQTGAGQRKCGGCGSPAKHEERKQKDPAHTELESFGRLEQDDELQQVDEPGYFLKRADFAGKHGETYQESRQAHVRLPVDGSLGEQQEAEERCNRG